MLDGPVVILGILALAAAAIAARTADVIQTTDIVRPLILALILPIIWLAFQAIPMPFAALSHSVWASAAAALHENRFGHISIDPGLTVATLLEYLSGVVLILATILVTRDRRRAEQTLFALGVVTPLAASTLLAIHFGQSSASARIFSASPDALATVSSLGLIIDLSVGIRVIERFESRRGQAEYPAGFPIAGLMICAAGALLCLLAFISVATIDLGIVTGFAVVAFLLVQAVRRFGLAPWMVGALFITYIAGAAMIVIWRYGGNQALPFVLQFATTSGEATATAQRMLADTGWLGSGGGTFAALLPIYQDAGATAVRPPTTVAGLAIEWGRPAMLAAVACVIWLIIVLFRGALARGRDSFYPAGAAACVVFLLGQAFCNVGLSQSAVSLLVEVVIGLGLAQSTSRAGTG